MNKTNIEWVKNPDGSQGFTWNPITGCLNGCEYCYARKLANGRLRSRYLDNRNIAPIGTMIEGAAMGERALKDPFYPRFWPERLLQAEAKGKVAGKGTFLYYGSDKSIFVCDMSDLFGIGIPEDWTERVMTVIRSQPQHRFYLLTKQPQNLIKWSPFPDNCWVGVSATGSKMAWNGYADLVDVIATVKYLSFEPLLFPIDTRMFDNFKGTIQWVIIGSQTRPTIMPKIEWVQEIALACTKAHIPLFLKDNLRPLLPNRMPFWCPVYWTECDKGASIRMTENRLRQELPDVS